VLFSTKHKVYVQMMDIYGKSKILSMFDGDEMNIHIAQAVQPRNELKRIANVKYQIIGAKDSNPIIGCVQDALSGSYLLTKLDTKIKGSDVANFLCNTSSETKNEIDLDKIYTGHEIFSHIIPKGINNTVIKYDKKVLEFLDGDLKIGVLDKSTLSKVKNSIIHFIWDKYGPDKTRRFIDDSQRLALAYLNYHGFTFGVRDCMTDPKIDEQIKKMIQNKLLEYNISLTQYENETDQINTSIVEANLSSELNAFSSEIGNIIMKSLGPDNNLFVCVDSKSKGSLMNMQHMMGCVGQKSVEGTRIKKKVENRSLPIFHKDDDTPEARGFIKSSFFDGLSSYEFFYDAMAGREGLIDTAIKTAKTGYIQRQLIKGLEDLTIKYDNTNRNAKNVIIQYVYGENGIDQSCQTELTINLISLNNDEIEETYGFTKDEISKLEKEHKIKDFTKLNKSYIEKIQKFRDNLRYIQMVANNNYKTLEEKYMLPVNLFRLTQDYSKNKVNTELSPQEILDELEELFNSTETRLLPGLKDSDKNLLSDDRSMKYLFEISIHDYLCPKKCIFKYGLSKKDFKQLINEIKLNFMKALVQPGEMVGIIAAQSIGEPSSQMSTLYSHQSKIVIKNKKNNSIKLYSGEIGKLIDKIINKNPDLTYGTGHENSVETNLEPLNKEYYIVGVDKQEKTHWNKISHVSKHPVNGQLMKITTRSGRSVETTLSHSHLVRRNQSVEPIIGADLKLGMRIPVTKHINNDFIHDNVVIEGISYKLDHLFGWFIGAYLAEGSINGTTVKITNISEHYMNNTTEFAKLFNKEVKIRKYQGQYGPGVDTSFNYKPFIKFLTDTCGKGSFNKVVPDFAFLAPNEFKAGLIQGYIDGDGEFISETNKRTFNDLNNSNHNGNFNNHGSRNNIRVCSRSEQLIKDVSLLLSYFDIFAHIRCDYVRGSDMYEIDISSKYASLYKEHIGTKLHEDKLNNILEYLSRQDITTLREDIDKIEGLGNIIAECGKTLNLPGQSRNYGRWAKKDSIGRRTLEKYITIFESHEKANLITSQLNILRQAANSNVIWDEITSIEIYTPDQSTYVYDFTVPGNQTFMIDSGIIIHNTLNTKHSAGVASKSLTTGGVPRIEELLHYSRDIKTPQMTIYFDKEISNDRPKVNKISSYLTHLTIKELISGAEIYYDTGSDILKNDEVSNPFFINNQKVELSSLPFVFRIRLNMEKMHDKETTLLDIKTKFISHWTKYFTNLKNMKKNEKDIFSKISRCAILSNSNVENQIIHIRFNMSSFNYNLLTDFLKIVLEQITLKGIDNINNSDLIHERKLNFNSDNGNMDVGKEYVVYTSGINMEKLKYIKGINNSLTTCNDISTIYRLYGIEAARQILYNEFVEVMEFSDVYINYHHLSLLCDRMSVTKNMVAIFRSGLHNDNIGPIAKATFEVHTEILLHSARHADFDEMRGVSANVMCGQMGYYGTGAFNVVLDMKEINKLEDAEIAKGPADISIHSDKKSECAKSNIEIKNNIASIHQ
jgi:DNA-directed RNA polymerase beta' subunit